MIEALSTAVREFFRAFYGRFIGCTSASDAIALWLGLVIIVQLVQLIPANVIDLVAISDDGQVLKMAEN